MVTGEGGEAEPAWKRGQKQCEHLSVQLLGWRHWGQNDDEETQMFVTEQILTVPKQLNLLRARLRVAAFPRAARAGALVILCIRKESWV